MRGRKGFFSKIGAAVGRFFGKRPVAPKLPPKSRTMGHRGIAAGKLPNQAGIQKADKLDAEIKDKKASLQQMVTANAPKAELDKVRTWIDKAEKRSVKLRNPQEFQRYGGTDKWQTLGGDVVEGFVNGDYLPVHSSNLAAAQYHKEDQKLMIEFLSGSAYLYSGVTEQEAIEFAQAQSKGNFVWTSLRRRGSKTGHKKPYVRLR